MIRTRIVYTLLAGLALQVVATECDAEPVKEFFCRWADVPIVIDGKADEKGWERAETIDNFYLPWLQKESRPARTATKARLLWDREYLYFFAEMEDSDVYANVKEHDGMLWSGDVFELFFKPADDKPGYYEFQVNPAAAVLDMFIPRRGTGGFDRYIDDGKFHIEAKVQIDGTLNEWSDKDRNWQVEGRIPWGDFLRTGGRPKAGETWKFALCRYDYSVDFEGPDLSTCAPLNSKNHADFHHWEDYAKLKFLGPRASSAVKPYGIEKRVALTTSRVIGSPDPLPPYVPQRAYPKFKTDFPVFAAVEPGSRRLLFIDQKRPYAQTRVCRTKDDPASGEYDVLLNLPGVAYSIAFHPKFAENGYLYLGWNGGEQGAKTTRITRYTIERNPPFRLLADSAATIIEWPSDGHNGGAVTFGHDGLLYITSGDGTSDSDTNLRGQGLDHLLSKALRIDVDHPADGKPYSVPKDNPFIEREGALPETFAYGLRNPWRITTDAKTGDIWIGNNGQDLWEQVYLLQRGANYGWSVYEGSHPFYLTRKHGPTPLVKPAAEHHHSEARSLTGGVVYHGKKLPGIRGMYVYGDYSTGKIWAIRRHGKKFTEPLEIADTELKISGFVTDADGELLIIDHNTPEGGFHRLRLRPNQKQQQHFPRTLSESGLFASVAEHKMQPGVIPYSVNSPLWSDGAYKQRYIAMPGDDPKIEYHPTRSWSFPEGTVLVKSFALEMIAGDPASRKWVETRFFTKQQGEWAGYSYAWNDEQKDATLVDKQGRDRDFAIRTNSGQRKQSWHFPSRAECMVCHSRAAIFVLGVSTGQLNKDHDYGDVVDNQLRTLESLQLLKIDPQSEIVDRFRQLLIEAGKPEKEADDAVEQSTATRDQRQAPASDWLLPCSPAACENLADPYNESADLTKRARSYLHVNCASCHIMAGGGNAQFEMEYGKPLDETKLVGVKPRHNSFDIRDALLIAPGEPGRSLLLHRMSIRGPGQMPPMATSHVDTAAQTLLQAWIAQMKP